MALVRKTRQGGAVAGSPGGAPGWISLTEQVRAAKRQKSGLGRQTGLQREKAEENVKTDAVLSYIRGYQPQGGWSNEITLARYSPLDLERGCSPRLTHEADNSVDNARHLRNVYHSLREMETIGRKLSYATKQEK